MRLSDCNNCFELYISPYIAAQSSTMRCKMSAFCVIDMSWKSFEVIESFKRFFIVVKCICHDAGWDCVDASKTTHHSYFRSCMLKVHTCLHAATCFSFIGEFLVYFDDWTWNNYIRTPLAFYTVLVDRSRSAEMACHFVFEAAEIADLFQVQQQSSPSPLSSSPSPSP